MAGDVVGTRPVQGLFALGRQMVKAVALLTSFLVGCLIVSGWASARGLRRPSLAAESAALTLARQDRVETPGVEVTSFGRTRAGESASLIVCRNRLGQIMKLTDNGAAMVSLELPDRHGVMANVLLTCPDLAGFETCGMYFNAIAGRYANRIAKGRFTIDGREYQLATNNGEHHLHGGERGFDKRIWKFEPFSADEGVGVRFSYTSPDGEEGYPGTVQATATYTLTHQGELVVELTGTTDRPTHLNLTNHNYWNLHGGGDILGHELQLWSSRYIPVDDGGIPVEGTVAVEGTVFDFRKPKRIGDDIGQLQGDPGGYDHCFVVDGTPGEMRPAARLRDPESGRWMEISTTEPGIQFYSGNYLNGEAVSAGYGKHSGLCLETERYPDTPNRPDFPASLLLPGQVYWHKTVHRFGTDR